jgi:hypothetical protein
MTVQDRALRDILNEASPGKLPSAMQSLAVGRAFVGTPRMIRDATVAAAPADTIVLPNAARAAYLFGGYARAGGTTGLLTAIQAGVPAVTQISITPDGNLVMAAADAVTDAEAYYVAHEGDLVVETGVDVVAGVLTPAFARSAVCLIEATVVTGVIPGAKAITARGGAPAAGNAAIGDLGTILFNAADIVNGTATVTYIAYPGLGNAEEATAEKLDNLLDF